jgi:hypothetical protein
MWSPDDTAPEFPCTSNLKRAGTTHAAHAAHAAECKEDRRGQYKLAGVSQSINDARPESYNFSM